MIKINYSGRYKTMLKDQISDEELADLISAKIKLFQNNPEDTRLDNHALRKSMEGKWAFGITGSIRIVYEWTGTNTVRFLAIGRHEDVYLRLL